MMKRTGLSLMTMSALVVCFVVFQNCSGFQSTPPGGVSNAAAINLSLNCNGAFQVNLFGQTMTVSMSQASTGLFTMSQNGSVIGSGSCTGGKFTMGVTGTTKGTCTGNYTVANNKTTISGTCTSSGAQTPLSGTQL